MAAKLPFHVAIVPPVAVVDPTVELPQGGSTELTLAFDEEKLAARLEAALSQTFLRVSRLQAPAGTASPPDPRTWIAAAEGLGADLLLVPALRYGPKVSSSLNDRFWLNLPLFAIGGPFCWFVSDRSYHCYSRLDAELFDVAAAASRTRRGLDDAVRVSRLDREAGEASLSFLQRADGAGSYLLSVICPAGFLATESEAVPAQLEDAVSAQLCQSLARTVQDRAREITETDLVDFHPRSVRVVREGDRRFLIGEVTLELGAANELGTLRYRMGGGAFVDAAWGMDTLAAASGRRPSRRTYPFRIPVEDAASGTIQLEVRQLDSLESRRTFTFSLDAGDGVENP